MEFLLPEGYDAKWIAVVLAAAIGLLAVLGLFTANFLLAPKRPSADKAVAYESGIRPRPLAWSQVNIRYYVFGLLFLIFDVEAVFLFPWAVVFLRSTPAVFYEMLIFIGILLFGLAYAWRKGALRWR
ncbi:MAG: NADH-quinone oxidoreductase subunit A [Chloroflexi bacterium]|nr:NADH-quinone oxidoreductase subunit A [Chloroflexota bacterium]